MRPSQFDQRAIETIHRPRVASLLSNILDDIVFRERQPGSACREAGVFPVIPLHRRARAIPPESLPWYSELEWIADVLRVHRQLLHGDLVAVIDRRRATQCQQQ